MNYAEFKTEFKQHCSKFKNIVENAPKKSVKAILTVGFSIAIAGLGITGTIITGSIDTILKPAKIAEAKEFKTKIQTKFLDVLSSNTPITVTNDAQEQQSPIQPNITQINKIIEPITGKNITKQTKNNNPSQKKKKEGAIMVETLPIIGTFIESATNNNTQSQTEKEYILPEEAQQAIIKQALSKFQDIQEEEITNTIKELNTTGTSEIIIPVNNIQLEDNKTIVEGINNVRIELSQDKTTNDPTIAAIDIITENGDQLATEDIDNKTITSIEETLSTTTNQTEPNNTEKQNNTIHNNEIQNKTIIKPIPKEATQYNNNTINTQQQSTKTSQMKDSEPIGPTYQIKPLSKVTNQTVPLPGNITINLPENFEYKEPSEESKEESKTQNNIKKIYANAQGDTITITLIPKPQVTNITETPRATYTQNISENAKVWAGAVCDIEIQKQAIQSLEATKSETVIDKSAVSYMKNFPVTLTNIKQKLYGTNDNELPQPLAYTLIDSQDIRNNYKSPYPEFDNNTLLKDISYIQFAYTEPNTLTQVSITYRSDKPSDDQTLTKEQLLNNIFMFDQNNPSKELTADNINNLREQLLNDNKLLIEKIRQQK